MSRWASSTALTLGVMAAASLSLPATEPIVPRREETVHLRTIPFPCTFVNAPKEFKLLSGNALSILASGGSDLYNDCGGTTKSASAPMLLFEPDTQFVLTTALTVDFKHEFDGGFLVVYEDEDHWAKLLFEQSHMGPLSVCSAVTNGFSDDTVNTDVPVKKVWFRIARVEHKFYFYLSQDGSRWTYIRYFRSPFQGKAKIGFASQSPDGKQCKATFSQIHYSPRAPKDLWTGE